MYDKLPVAVVRVRVKNLTIKIDYINDVAESLFGYQRAEATTPPFRDDLLFRVLVERDWHRFARACIDAVLQKTEKFQYKGTCRKRDGTEFTVVISALLQYTETGIPIRGTVFIQHVEETKLEDIEVD